MQSRAERIEEALRALVWACNVGDGLHLALAMTKARSALASPPAPPAGDAVGQSVSPHVCPWCVLEKPRPRKVDVGFMDAMEAPDDGGPRRTAAVVIEISNGAAPPAGGGTLDRRRLCDLLRGYGAGDAHDALLRIQRGDFDTRQPVEVIP